MKKQIFALVSVCLAATASVVFAGPGAGTGINGSLHDMNAAPGYTGDSLGRTCVFCHTPHNARKTDALVPLWNHADSQQQVMAPYTWVAPTNTGITFNPDPLIGPSRLCMACHDGVTAVDSHGSANAGAPTGSTIMTSSYTDALGATAKRYITDLTVTHPIGFQYDEAATRRTTAEIIPSARGFIKNAPVSNTWDTSYGSSSRTAAGETDKKIKDTLYGGFLTCASCHEVHNTVNAKPEAGHSYNYFLYAKQEGSAICLSCHVK
jgi:hypothetical protein